jgi:tetratricopeptide (TPR) repeat protein
VYIYAPPPAAYSTVVYETIVLENEEVPAGEDVLVQEQASGNGVAETPVPIERQAEMNRAADYYLTLGDRAFRDSRFGDAVHYYAKAVEFSTQDGILYLILSDALFATGDYHYAAYALRKALELDPGLAGSVVDKHAFYSDPTEFDRQLAVLERYFEDHTEDGDARLVLAANYLFGNRPAAAVDLLSSASSEAVANSPAGQVILESAQSVQYGQAE